jgi:hypothetical protein
LLISLGVTKEFKHLLTKKLWTTCPLHLHLYRIAIKDWYGPGKDLKVVAPIDSRWRRSLDSSGFGTLLLSALESNGDIVVPNGIIKPSRPVQNSDDMFLLKEKEEGFDC